MTDDQRPRPASDFYTGIVAELYGALRSVAPDPDPYARFVQRSGEPALELGCGDGDPLLDLVERGLRVEGLDSSLDMIERARRRAADRGIEVVLHCAPMERMDLGRTYGSIYLAGPTFNLLPDDATALAALTRIREHLAPTGRALIPLFVPPPSATVGIPRQQVQPDGTVFRVTTISESRDEQSRQLTSLLRYEVDAVAGDRSEERAWVLHWYDRAAFPGLCEQAGLDVVTERDLGPDAWAVVLGRRP